MTKRKKFIIRSGGRFPEGIRMICPFEVNLGNDYDAILVEDIEKFVEGKWSSYLIDNDHSCNSYFFELESDAMAFKLKWL